MAFGFNQLGLFGKAYVVQEMCLCSYEWASAPACVQHYSFIQVNRKSNGSCNIGKIPNQLKLDCQFNTNVFVVFRSHYITSGSAGPNVNLFMSPESRLWASLKMLRAQAGAAKARHRFLLLLGRLNSEELLLKKSHESFAAEITFKIGVSR